MLVLAALLATGLAVTLFSVSSSPVSRFPHAWEACVGSGHAALALRSDWRTQIERSRRELGTKRVRFHGLFDDDMNVVVANGTTGNYYLSFYNVDLVLDHLFSIGVDPFVELSFSPALLATGNASLMHYRANVSPPDLGKWSELVSAFAAHLLDRYGVVNATRLYFEVWNEYNCGFLVPNNASQTPRQAYYAIYAATAAALKAVHPGLRVGGPVTCGSNEVAEFLAWAAANRVPVDFASTHVYPTDPNVNLGRMAPLVQQTLDQVAPFKVPLLYTEWNDGLFGDPAYHDTTFASSYVVKAMAQLNGRVPLMSFWTFSDVFEEQGFPAQEFDKPTWTGWGLLSASNIAKPVYRAFQLLHEAGHFRLPVVSPSNVTENDDVNVLALSDDKAESVTLFVYNNHWISDPTPARAAIVGLELRRRGMGGSLLFEMTRIDENTLAGNAPKAWRADGRPKYLKPADVARYSAISELAWAPVTCVSSGSDDACVLPQVALPPQSLVVFREHS